MFARALLLVGVALGSLLVTACLNSSSLAVTPGEATPRPIGPASPTALRTPSGIFISTSVRPTESPAVITATARPKTTALIVLGRVFDAGSGQRLQEATIEWQFLAPDWQQFNGQLQVPADGLYRLQLPVRSEDEVIITAYAPGHLPSTARLLGKQLNLYGSRLNFGLVTAGGPVPTVPGALGIIELNGIVYDSARGLQDRIANARVTIVDRSLVRPKMQIDATTSITGAFVIPVSLHVSDQIDVTIAASGYQTLTLTKSAAELARKPHIAIGLKPAPRP
jgi:hypothetical protein